MHESNRPTRYSTADDDLLDDAIASVRADEAPRDEVQASLDRTWSRLSAGISREESEHAWRQATPGSGFAVPATRADTQAPRAPVVSLRSPRVRFAIAAAVALAIALGAVSFGDQVNLGGQVGAVHASEGGLVRLTGAETLSLAPGEAVQSGSALRTAPGAWALLELPDGTRVELDERAEIRLDKTLFGTRLRVVRGRVIVTDAAGRLSTSTPDGTVVDGNTAYSINRGVLGTRVVVLEGEAELEDPAGARTLRAGEQFTSGDNLAPASIGAEIDWSHDSESYAQLIAAVESAREGLSEALSETETRTTSRLPGHAPERTLVYAAFPNVAEDVVKGQREIFEALRRDPRIAGELTEGSGFAAEDAEQVARALDAIQNAATVLGDEIAVAWVGYDSTEGGGSTQVAAEASFDMAPVLLAEVVDVASARSRLDEVVSQMNSVAGEPVIVWLDAAGPTSDGRPTTAVGSEQSPTPARSEQSPTLAGSEQALALAGSDQLTLALADDVLVLSPQRALVDGILHGETGLPDDFSQTLAAAYSRGVQWVAVANVKGIVEASTHDLDADDGVGLLSASGLMDADYLVFEHSDGETRGVLSFADERHGLAAWLAEPAPVGALAFVSGDAALAGAFASRNGVDMFDDLLAIMGVGGVDASVELAEVESELGIDPRADLASAIGGEFAFAVDGAVFPEPAWKVAVEVLHPERLQHALEAIASRASERDEPITIDATEEDGRVFYEVGVAGRTKAVYTFVDGYLLAAPRRELLTRAIRYRDDGFTLERSAKFRSLLPKDAQPHFSALWYQDLRSALEPLAAAGEIAGGEEALAALDAMSDALAPSLAVAYAEDNQIRVATTGGNGPLGLDFAGLMTQMESLGLEEGLSGPR